MSIRRALVPCAGRGTRMRPISDLLPKELVPLGTTPALRFVIEEARAAGIREIGVVQRPGKPQIESYLRSLADDPQLGDVEFHFLEQAEPTGLGDAITLAREFLADEPFALLLPDNWLPSPDYRLRELIDVHERTGGDVLGVLELDASHSGRFGNCGRIDFEPAAAREAAELGERVLRIRRLHSKGAGVLEIPAGATLRRTCGRYVCRPWLHDYLDRVRPEVEEELSEVPAYQRIVDEHGAWGVVLPQPVFDLGNPEGYLSACAWLWHDRGEKLR